MMKYQRVAAAVAVAALAITLTACSATTDAAPSASSTAAADPKLTALLPADIQQSKVVKGGSAFDVPPIDYYENGTQPSGMLMDVLTEASARLGVTVQWQQIQYGGLIPALQSNRIDLAGAQINKSKGTQGVVNLLGLYTATNSLAALSSSSYASATSIDALCGASVEYTSSSPAGASTAQTLADNCTKKGLAAIKLVPTDTAQGKLDALRAGRVDINVDATVQLEYQVKQAGDQKVLGVGTFNKRVTGVALGIEDTQLTAAYQAAVNAMIADGSYRTILKKWNLDQFALDKAVSNGDIPCDVGC